MKVITFSAIKGGCGKSALSILIANYLSNAGYRVLCIDLDIQNSMSFYYFPNLLDNKKNIASALFQDNLNENIIKDLFIHLIPSSLSLIKCRALEVKTLLRLKNQIESDYDFCIIDTAPTLDNIVLNAVNFSDYIISPFQLDLFNFKSLEFYEKQLTTETDKINNWYQVYNFYTKAESENPNTEKNQYKTLFENRFKNILKSKIFNSSQIKKAIDFKSKIKQDKISYESISNLCKELLNIDKKPVSF